MRALPLAILFAATSAAAYTPRTLDSVLEDRVAGAPAQCITLNGVSDRSSLFPGAIVYKQGAVWYLNRPRDCDQIRPDRAIATVTPNNRLCSGDIVRVSQPTTGFVFGSCPLGEFIPYTRTQPSRP